MLIAHWTDPYIPYSLTKPFHHSDAFNSGEVFKAIKEFLVQYPRHSVFLQANYTRRASINRELGWVSS